MTETNLAQLFSDGLSKIQTRKCDNLFKDLDDRNLTEAEESIIAQRVDLQRRMLEEYEKREKARKVREILDVCPDLTEEEAECALKMHGYKEEDAAAALTSGIAFRRKVQAMCGNSRPQPGTAVPPARLPAPQCHDWPRVTMVGPVGARPTGDFLKHIGDGVFVGTFKGKGWEMYKSRPLPQLKTSAAVPLNNASQTLPQKKRGRPPGRPASAQLCPPRPRSTKRHALRSSNAEPSPSTPPAARRRRSGRLNPSGARSPAPEEPELPKRQLEDSDELIAAAPESGFKPRSLPVKAPVLEQQEKVEKASQRPHDATESGTSSMPVFDLVRFAADVLHATVCQCPARLIRRIAIGWYAPVRHGCAVTPHIEFVQRQDCFLYTAGALEEVGQSCSNKYHKFPAHSHEGTEQNASHPPPHPLSPSPQSPTASQEPRAVPRRQRGSRRSKQGTPRLPWKQGGEQADVDGEPEHAENNASGGPQLQSQQFSPANGAVSDVAKLDERPPLQQQTPVINAMDRSEDKRALDDHQVANVSSRKASRGKDSTRGNAKSSDSRDDAAKQETVEAESSRPKRQRRASAKATEALLNVVLAADMQAWSYSHHSPRGTLAKSGQGTKRETEPEAGLPQSPGRSPRANRAATSPGARAAAAHAAVLVNKPRLGRVKRCSSKQVEVLSIGELRLDAGWHNNGYIFPEGFCTRTVFRSSVELDQLCLHTCSILGREGHNWPAPTFRIIAADRPDEALDAKSPTGAWNAVLSRINGEIEARRRAGADLPPPPKTAIAGPEYFGLTHPEVLMQIEALDPDRLCAGYWAGKEDRLAYGQVHGVAPDRKHPSSGAAAAQQRLFPVPSGGAARRRKRGGRVADNDGDGMGEAQEDIEEVYAGNRWSGVDRAERARRRAGDDCAAADADNPLPHVIDPITLEPVVTPAMSPAGHVMGLATWTAVLAEQGKCPFTQQPLRRNQITVLTKGNIERFQDRIKLP